jgi:hypothetical protein
MLSKQKILLTVMAGLFLFIAQARAVQEMSSKSLPHSQVYMSSHIFNLQIMDSNYISIPGTSFPVTTTIKYNDSFVKIDFPAITFTTTDVIPPSDPNGGPATGIAGGFVTTQSNGLPSNLCPLETQTSLQILNSPFLLGLNLSIDTYGKFMVAASNLPYAIIPAGTYTIPAFSISYLLYPEVKNGWITNEILQSGFTNVTEWTAVPLNDNLRDNHPNDIWKGNIVWSWASNVDQPSISNNTSDAFFAKAKINKKTGKPEIIIPPKNLTNFTTSNQVIFYTNVAINRKDENNIVFSFQHNDSSVSPRIVHYSACVSFDGGNTWTAPFDVSPLNPGDNGADTYGVKADKYGNFWFNLMYTDGSEGLNINHQEYFYTSIDKGLTWQLIYNTDDVITASYGYDYAQLALGNDGDGNYGLWWNADCYQYDQYNNVPRLGFIPTTGLGEFGTPQKMELNNLKNVAWYLQPTVSSDGHVFMAGNLGNTIGINFYANTFAFKSPGPFDPLLVHAPQTTINTTQDVPQTIAIPEAFYSWFIQGALSITVDNKRNVIYTTYCEQPDDQSQDFYLYFILSFDQGKTWSPRIPIATSHLNNRGHETLVLDEHDGGLYFGWYDGRNDPSQESVQYFLGYITSEKLDKLVKLMCNYMSKGKNSPKKLIQFYVVDSNNQRTGKSFKIPVEINSENSDILVQFPLFNFEMPTNGGFLESSKNSISHKLLFSGVTSFTTSCNDVYLQTFDQLNFPSSLPIVGYQVSLDCDGKIKISLSDGSIIPAGGHTFNSQALTINY